jgi:hypothetical protein
MSILALKANGSQQWDAMADLLAFRIGLIVEHGRLEGARE